MGRPLRCLFRACIALLAVAAATLTPSAVSAAVLAAPASGAVALPLAWTVNSTVDAPDAAPGDAVCAAASGECTLRAAIQEANANAAYRDTITFDIPGPSPHTILYNTCLPEIVDAVEIDGTSEPDYLDRPVVVLDGSNTATAAYPAGHCSGLVILAGPSIVRGLAINNLLYYSVEPDDFIGIRIENAPGSVVESSTVGLSADGTAKAYVGEESIRVENSANVRIGGTAPGAGNVLSGVATRIISSPGAVVQGNLFGTDITGGTVVQPTSLEIIGSDGVLVGGGQAGAGNLLARSSYWNAPNVRITSTDGATVQGNWIGLLRDGSPAGDNIGWGIEIYDSANVLVGGTAPGEGNVIIGQLEGGIYLHNSPGGVRVQGNTLGLDPAGGLAALGDRGIYVYGSPGSQIGGTTAGAGNVIANATAAGIDVNSQSDGTLIQGNFVGTNRAGTLNYGSGADGINLASGANTVGGSQSGAGNLIVYSDGHGVHVKGPGQVITGNRIHHNAGAGVRELVTGTGTVSRNAIYANAGLGIDLGPAGVTPNDIPDLDGVPNMPALTALTPGVGEVMVDGQVEGLPDTAFRVEFFASDACDPAQHGEGQTYLGALDVMTDAAGYAAFSHALSGASPAAHFTATVTNLAAARTSEFSQCLKLPDELTFTVNSTLDEPDASPGDAVCAAASGVCTLRAALQEANARIGLQTNISFGIPGEGPHTIAVASALPAVVAPTVLDATTQPGYAGAPLVVLDGTPGAGGSAYGLDVQAADSAVRGLGIVSFAKGLRLGGSGGVAQANVIARNNGAGVGIEVEADGVLIGGPADADGNVILEHDGVGVLVSGADGVTIKHNYIGVDREGAAGGGSGVGVSVWRGIAHVIDANTIAGHRAEGIYLNQTQAEVTNNWIGTDAAGTPGIGNGMGVAIYDGSASLAGNRVMHNAADGVRVLADARVAISQNAIHDNGGLGINLGVDGVTPNDAGDPDPGPNGLQNFPVLASAEMASGEVTVKGTLNSAPNATFALEFFASASCDPAGHGEGAEYLGRADVSTDAGGDAAFTVTLAGAVESGTIVTATATDSAGRTSEFSACQPVTQPVCHALTRVHSGSGADPFASPAHSANCSAGYYTAGEAIALSASPDTGWQVAGWAGTADDTSTAAANSLTMPDRAHSVSVAYEPVPPACYALTLTHTGDGSDPVAMPTHSAGCAAGQYVAGASLTLSAAPASGWVVGGWDGTAADASTSTTNTLVMPGQAHTVSVGYRYKLGSIFADVPYPGKEWMQPWIEQFYEAGLTTGCAVYGDDLLYCPEREVTRAEMAVFILRALHYPGLPYTPLYQAGTFADVPYAGKEWMEPWIEEFFDLKITTGCALDPLRYCPERKVTRAEMAVFILRAKYGGGYEPPSASGTFADVPVAGKEWMEPWIEQFYEERITTGCGVSGEYLLYCPEREVTRAEMAVFILRAFDHLPKP